MIKESKEGKKECTLDVEVLLLALGDAVKGQFIMLKCSAVELIGLGLYLYCNTLTQLSMCSLEGNSRNSMIPCCPRMSPQGKACNAIDPQPSRFLGNRNSMPLNR